MAEGEAPADAESGADTEDLDLRDLRHVGPVTAAVLREAEVSTADLREKRVDHETLVAAGVNPGVAARIRREHSLAWSHSTGGDLTRRADQVGGLGDAERAWVAASSGDWSAEEARTGEREAWRTAEAAWREGDPPEPVTELEDVSAADAGRLAEAGVNSIRSLARADGDGLAASLDLDPEQVAAWQRAAREAREARTE